MGQEPNKSVEDKNRIVIAALRGETDSRDESYAAVTSPGSPTVAMRRRDAHHHALVLRMVAMRRVLGLCIHAPGEQRKGGVNEVATTTMDSDENMLDDQPEDDTSPPKGRATGTQEPLDPDFLHRRPVPTRSNHHVTPPCRF